MKNKIVSDKLRTFYNDKIIHRVVKESWDEMWHAYYFITWNPETQSIHARSTETYVRVKEKDALKLFVHLL